MVLIKGFPTDINFFTGLSLKRTCSIQIMSSELHDIQSISLKVRWSRSNISIVPDNHLTITDPFQLKPMQYQTILLFNSLDKNRDDGEYTCSSEVTVYHKQNVSILRDALTCEIIVQSKYFK